MPTGVSWTKSEIRCIFETSKKKQKKSEAEGFGDV
jgi:hypothetical protein